MNLKEQLTNEEIRECRAMAEEHKAEFASYADALHYFMKSYVQSIHDSWG